MELCSGSISFSSVSRNGISGICRNVSTSEFATRLVILSKIQIKGRIVNPEFRNI